MTEAHNADHVWELMDKIGFCMFASLDGEWIRSRPMGAYIRAEENAIYLLTDVDSAKDAQVAAHPHVNLAFADPSGQTYVSLTGRATISNDRKLIKELFSTPAKAWWDDAEDPSIRVLKITPHDAQTWDSPGTVVSYIKMAAAILTDSKPDLGDREKVDLSTP